MTDYDHLLKNNLARVFSERDPVIRMDAIRELYTPDAVLVEPDSIATGSEAICEAVTVLLRSLPHDLIFEAVGPAVGHHDAARLKWRAGPPGGPVIASGTDFIHVHDGRIQKLLVFLDPPLAPTPD